MYRQATVAIKVAEYLAAVGFVAAAGVLRWALPSVLGETLYLAFYPAVVAAAAFFGRGPGLVATALSFVLVELLFDATPGRINLHDPVVLGRMLAFCGGGIGISLVAGMKHAAQRRRDEQAEVLREKERALRESEERFRAVCDNARAAFGILVGTRLVYANRYFSELTGYGVDEIVGMDFRQMTHPSFHQLMVDRARKRLAGEPVPNHYEFLAVTKDGRERWVDFSPAVTELNGKAVIIGTGFDVTERKRTEERMRAAQIAAERAQAVAEEASRAKDHFLAVLSHELRTPLAPVLTGVSMLQETGRYDADTSQTLEVIRRNAELEARLIDDLLDVTRIAQGKVELDRRLVALCEVIRRAVEVCRPDIEARGLHFGVDLGAEAPYIVHADVARLQQVFWNLLKNAVKFTPPGGCVGIRCRYEDGNVLAEVNDSGIGIEPHALPHLFKPFEQGERGVTRQFGGLGLGLTISKAMVEMHGGSIEASSDGRNRGATFRVRLPMVKAAPEREKLPAAPAPPARALRILLVEDHGDTARIMCRLLKAKGHEVETAGDVATALEVAQHGGFDLLLSDLGLPDGSGLDLMRQLVAQGKHIPAIALSGYGQEQDITQSREAGFAAHLTKPVNVTRLFSMIGSVVGQSAASAVAQEQAAS